MTRAFVPACLALSVAGVACSVPAPATDDTPDTAAGAAGATGAGAAGAPSTAGRAGGAGATLAGHGGGSGATAAGSGGISAGSGGGAGATTAGSAGASAGQAGASGQSGAGQAGASGQGGAGQAGASGQGGAGQAGASGQGGAGQAGASGQAGAGQAGATGQAGAGGHGSGDTCAAPVLVTAVPFVLDASTMELTSDYGVDAGQCPGVSTSQGHASPDAVYAFTPPESGTYDVVVKPSKIPTLYDPLLYVATACPPAAGTCLGASDEVPLPSNGGVEQLTLALTAGATVYVFVDGTYDKNGSAEGARGNYELSITKRP